VLLVWDAWSSRLRLVALNCAYAARLAASRPRLTRQSRQHGLWKTRLMRQTTMAEGWISVARSATLSPKRPHGFLLNGARYVVWRGGSDRPITVVPDSCIHRGGRLSMGRVMEDGPFTAIGILSGNPTANGSPRNG
jgi:hypothetical protein